MKKTLQKIKNDRMYEDDKIIIDQSLVVEGTDLSKVTKEDLLASTRSHILDVRRGIKFIIHKLVDAAIAHDHTKEERLDAFHEDLTSKFKKNNWLEGHIKEERHHLLRYTPSDVDLVDILEFLVDGVMAGMARAGYYETREIPDELLQRAFKNTVTKLLDNIEVNYG